MIPAKVNFAQLNKKERELRFGSLIKRNLPIRIWIKSTSDKLEFNIDSFDKEKSELHFEQMDTRFLDKEVLFNFEYLGQNYFGQGKIFLNKDLKKFVLSGIDKVYKSERRKNFRLLCYPMFDVVSRFIIEDHYEGENVVSLSSKENYDEIKKDFLAFHFNIENDEVGTIVRARVHDISATGIGIYIGEMEKDYFTDGKSFQNIKIQFFDNVLNIKDVKIVYAMPARGEIDGTYKIGMNFEEISETDEEKIVRKINQVLKEYNFDKDFEDFI